MQNPFRYFNSSPEVIRLAVMMYIRYPLSLRQVEDLLFERGIDICHETVRFWWNRFGPMFAAEVRKRRIHHRSYSQWRWLWLLKIPSAAESLVFSPVAGYGRRMRTIMKFFFDAAADTLRSRAELQFEILTLRQQLVILKREKSRPTLVAADRMFWVFLSQIWAGWRDALVIVTPKTVIRWHRAAFRLFWTMKSRRKRRGRQPVAREVRNLIRRMSEENTSWGAPRIHGELLKLGIKVSQASVSKYMVHHSRPPSQTWRTFLDNHVGSLASIDFFVVPTAMFAVLFVFVVLRHERRRIVHFGITAHPRAAWVAQQIREAFPWDTAPRYLIRDRDGVYGADVCTTVKAMGIEEVVTAPCSPWQNPYAERVIGSIRRECLDHVIVLNERHLRRILLSYFEYYHGSRTHLSLGKDAPDGRPVQSADGGKIVAFPQVGGLHHRYERLAA